ncbi:hypothetical protein C8T65DRAFT_73739 [Cerioporus squamosus]|nr:hypothetical protein C8T65DRAFT_73739 [Cerioporus squamosus]
MKPAIDGSSVSAWPTGAFLQDPRFERRSSDMTTGGVDKGAAGQPDSPVTSGGSGHSSSHISSAIPAVFVVLVIVIGSTLGWYIIKRLRRSGRRIRLLSFLLGSGPKPELSEVVITETTLRHTTWSTLSPIAVDFASSEERHLWELEKTRSPYGHTSSIPKTSRPQGSSAKRGNRAVSSTVQKVDDSASEHGGLRVTVFIAMPAQRADQVEGMPHWYDDRKIMSLQSTELCLGTVQTSAL